MNNLEARHGLNNHWYNYLCKQQTIKHHLLYIIRRRLLFSECKIKYIRKINIIGINLQTGHTILRQLNCKNIWFDKKVTRSGNIRIISKFAKLLSEKSEDRQYFGKTAIAETTHVL